MKKENLKYMIPALVAIPFMFIWIFITVFLTGGREITDFTETDKMVFSGFIIMELLTLTVIVTCIIKAQKLTNANNYNQANAVKIPPDKRRIVIGIISFLSLTATMIGGILLKSRFDDSLHNLIGIIALISLLLPVVLLITGVILNRIYLKKLKGKSIAENQEYWLSHRENPEETIAKKLPVLKTIIVINDLFSISLGLCAFLSAFFFGIIYDNSISVGPLFVSYITLSAATSRIRLKTPSSYFDDDKTYVPESEYPALYALAKKAAKAVGCTENIRIAFLDDFNAGSAKINKNISIQLGVLLLNSLSEDEVYCVLLHEFSHIKSENKNNRINNYYNFIHSFHGNLNTSFLSGITRHFFTFSDTLYNLQYQLYLYTVTVSRESSADNAMALYGNNEVAASSLVKIKYYELYDWQKGTYDAPCNMEPEKYDTNTLKNEVQRFKDFTHQNSEKWNTLINNEILSRSASHPTFKMRLENLGVNEIKSLSLTSSEGYEKDCEKAITYISRLIEEQNPEGYEEYRKFYYVESKELIEKWESNGRYIVAEEYGDICDALRRLGRNTEALELCENAIKLLDDAGSCYAYFIKGCFLLHSFDETGIEYIYHAIENNHNYISEGLEIIGRFCCLTGQEDQLEIYRERAVTLTEENNSLYAECGVLNKKDKLSPENLPDGMLEDILEHITAEHKDNIEKIYLVRKIITDDFFTSAFVIKMTSETDDDTRYNILHRSFNYLDTSSDWQFSLFDYEDVKNVKVEDVANSCVYTKQ